MNARKLFFILIVSVLVFGSISGVSSALFLDFLDDSAKQPDTNVSIVGINFTIPAGYEESKVNNSTDEYGIVTVNHIYAGPEDIIDISVLYNGPVDKFEVLDKKHSPTTIAGKDGMYASADKYYNFIYKQDDKMVSIVARNQSIVEKVISGK